MKISTFSKNLQNVKLLFFNIYALYNNIEYLDTHTYPERGAYNVYTLPEKNNLATKHLCIVRSVAHPSK